MCATNRQYTWQATFSFSVMYMQEPVVITRSDVGRFLQAFDQLFLQTLSGALRHAQVDGTVWCVHDGLVRA